MAFPRHRQARLASASFALATLLALSLGACGSDGGTGPNTATAIEIVSGTDQSVVVGTAPAPLVVRVTNSSGAPIAGAVVSWAVTAGGGSVSAATSTTDADGRAQITYSPTTTAGAVTIAASVVGRSPINFTVTMTAGALSTLGKFGSDNPAVVKGSTIALTVKAADQHGNGIAGVVVTWTTAGGGTLSAATSTTNAGGLATTSLVLPDATGTFTVTATAPNLPAITYTVTAI